MQNNPTESSMAASSPSMGHEFHEIDISGSARTHLGNNIAEVINISSGRLSRSQLLLLTSYSCIVVFLDI
jgi:hypothetical protein